MNSNFSKLLLSIFLCILVTFGDIPLTIKAETNKWNFPSNPNTISYGNEETVIYPVGTLHLTMLSLCQAGYNYRFSTNQSTGNALNYYNNVISKIYDSYSTYGAFSGYMNGKIVLNLQLQVQSKTENIPNCSLLIYDKELDLSWKQEFVVNGQYAEVMYYYDLSNNFNTVLIENLTPSSTTSNLYIKNFTVEIPVQTYLTWENLNYNTATFLSNFYANNAIYFTPKLKCLFSYEKNQGEIKYSISVNSAYLELNAQRSYTEESNTYKDFVYMPTVRPLTVAESRYILALRNIWSAINGQSGTENLDSTIKQQTETITNGYDNSQINNSNTELSNSLNKLEQAEAASSQALDSLKNFNGFDDSEMDNAVPGMQFISTTAQTIINSNSLIKVMILSAFIFFVISVIIGIRRYI